jgi:hypothetical protein
LIPALARLVERAVDVVDEMDDSPSATSPPLGKGQVVEAVLVLARTWLGSILRRRRWPVNNPYAVGEHVYLRPLEAEDAADIVRWFNDQDVSRTLRMWKPMTKGAEARFLEELASGRRDYCSRRCA